MGGKMMSCFSQSACDQGIKTDRRLLLHRAADIQGELPTFNNRRKEEYNTGDLL
jgi:hypothetical protein